MHKVIAVTQSSSVNLSGKLEIGYRFSSGTPYLLDCSTFKSVKIGSGSFGTVYKVSVEGQSPVAIKLCSSQRCQSLSEEKVSESQYELSILETLEGHPNIVKFHGAIVREDRLCGLQFKFYDGDLHHLIEKEEISIKPLTSQMIAALYYIHSQRIVHRDLKPQNIFYSDKAGDLHFVLGDFGAAFSRDKADIFGSYLVSRWYRPPEIVFCLASTTPAIDMWSLGCVLTEVLTRKICFSGNSSNDMSIYYFRRIGKTLDEAQFDALPIRIKKYFNALKTQNGDSKLKTINEFFDAYATPVNNGDLLRDFIVNLLNLNHETRMTVAQAQKHPYILDQ